MYQPLEGVHIVEFEGIGPAPLAGRILLGMGAKVTLIARPSKGAISAQFDIGQEDELHRGKHRVVLDLKRPEDRERAMELVAQADALIEGNRPGVMERLGFGPEACAGRNSRLVYGRMTGWGQTGPLAQAAGHDLNYVALTGMLALSARRGDCPIVPPTLVGDATGALGLAFGIVCVLFDALRSGRGRVVDAAIVDIVAMLGVIAQWIRVSGQLDSDVMSPFHDSPFYDVYRCSDGRFVTIAALEPQFYALLLEKLGLVDVDPRGQYDRKTWPALKARIGAIIAGRTRDEWCRLLEGTDVCFAPVLNIEEAAHHPHNMARQNYDVVGPNAFFGLAAPRFQELQAQPFEV